MMMMMIIITWFRAMATSSLKEETQDCLGQVTTTTSHHIALTNLLLFFSSPPPQGPTTSWPNRSGNVLGACLDTECQVFIKWWHMSTSSPSVDTWTRASFTKVLETCIWWQSVHQHSEKVKQVCVTICEKSSTQAGWDKTDHIFTRSPNLDSWSPRLWYKSNWFISVCSHFDLHLPSQLYTFVFFMPAYTVYAHKGMLT